MTGSGIILPAMLDYLARPSPPAYLTVTNHPYPCAAPKPTWACPRPLTHLHQKSQNRPPVCQTNLNLPPLDLTLVRHVVSAYAAKRIFDLDDRDDFVQDVIIKFHRKVDSSQHPARQMSFAKQVAATMLVDWIRSRNTQHRHHDIHAVPLPDESRCAPRPHTLGPDRADYCARTSTPSHSPFDEAEVTLDLSDIGRLIYDGYSPSDIEVDFGYSAEEISEVVEKLKAEILLHNKKLALRLAPTPKK